MILIKKKYLRQVIVSYIILALVQVAATVWINYNINNSAVEQQSVQNEAFQVQALSIIEDLFSELESVQYSLLSSECNLQYLSNNIENITECENNVIECLSTAFSESRFNYYQIQDIFVYYDDTDTIISGINGVNSSDEYINLYYTSDFNEQILSDNYEQEIHSTQYVGVDCVTVSLPYIDDDTYAGATAVIVLKNEFIFSLSNLSALYDTVQFAIFDSNGDLIISTLSIANIDGYDGINDYYNEYFNDIEYSVCLYEDSNQGYFYASYVPMYVYYDQFSALRDIAIMGMILFIVVSVLLAFRIAYKTYMPVKEIITKIQDNSEKIKSDVQTGNKKLENATKLQRLKSRKNSDKVSEFDYINNTLEKISNEKAMLLDKIDHQDAETEYAHIVRLVNGTIQASDKNYIENNKDIVSNKFIVILFRPEKYSLETLAIENEDEVFKGFTIVYKNILEELSLKYGFGYLLPKRLNKFTLLLNLKDEFVANYKAYVDELCDEFSNVLSSYFEITNSVSVGTLETGIERINNSYENAEYAMNYKFIYGRENIIHYKELPSNVITSSIDNMVYRDLINAYITGQTQDDAVTVVQKIMNEIDEKKISHMHINTFKYGCINALETAMRKFCENENAYSLIRLLSSSETIDEFKMILIDILQKFQEYNISSQTDGRLGNKIREYIDENYTDVNLCAITIAEHFEVSKTYISRVFKTDYDKTISEYITEVRIEKSKILLKNSDYSVKAISELTGFLSSNTFIRSFKKIVGVTPGKYLTMK